MTGHVLPKVGCKQGSAVVMMSEGDAMSVVTATVQVCVVGLRCTFCLSKKIWLQCKHVLPTINAYC